MQISALTVEGSQHRTPVEIETLLQEFSHVFYTLVGLPPIGGHEHQINLKEGAQLVCQRPYQYHFYQKNEIENIVKVLLSVGLIRSVVVLLPLLCCWLGKQIGLGGCA